MTTVSCSSTLGIVPLPRCAPLAGRYSSYMWHAKICNEICGMYIHIYPGLFITNNRFGTSKCIQLRNILQFVCSFLDHNLNHHR